MIKKLFLIACLHCQAYAAPIPFNIRNISTLLIEELYRSGQSFLDFFRKKKNVSNKPADEKNQMHTLEILNNPLTSIEIQPWHPDLPVRKVIEGCFQHINVFLDIKDRMNLRLCNTILKKEVDKLYYSLSQLNYPVIGIKKAPPIHRLCAQYLVAPSSYIFPVSYYPYTLIQENLFYGNVFSFLRDLYNAKDIELFSKSKFLNMRPCILVLDDKTLHFLNTLGKSWKEKIAQTNLLLIAEKKNALTIYSYENLRKNILYLNFSFEQLFSNALDLKSFFTTTERNKQDILSKKNILGLSMTWQEINDIYKDLINSAPPANQDLLAKVKRLSIVNDNPNWIALPSDFHRMLQIVPQIEGLSFIGNFTLSPTDPIAPDAPLNYDILKNIFSVLPHLRFLDLRGFRVDRDVLGMIALHARLMTLTLPIHIAKAESQQNFEKVLDSLEAFINRGGVITFAESMNSNSMPTLQKGMSDYSALVPRFTDIFNKQKNWHSFGLKINTKQSFDRWGLFLKKALHLQAISLSFKDLHNWDFDIGPLSEIERDLKNSEFMRSLIAHPSLTYLEIDASFENTNHREVFFDVLLEHLPPTIEKLVFFNCPENFFSQDILASLIYKKALNQKKFDLQVYFK